MPSVLAKPLGGGRPASWRKVRYRPFGEIAFDGAFYSETILIHSERSIVQAEQRVANKVGRECGARSEARPVVASAQRGEQKGFTRPHGNGV
jgi:hypothetical protein